ncbi:MAG: acyltransferase family protein [Lachnospiraceae bacterium]|nr:acyltransferase family protein [Lachnospiraceae bacterium]
MRHEKRESSFEVLRIISMYMIVFIHANMYQGYFFTNNNEKVFFNSVVNGICNIGVTCFILISGYFGLKFSVKKLLQMEFMMIGYSAIETLLLCVLTPTQMQGSALLEQLIKTALPFITRKYWFYSTYVCLFCLSGYIHTFIESLGKRELRKLLGIVILLFSVFPTLFYFEIVPDNGKGLIQMIIIYMIGGYIRNYGLVEWSKRKRISLFIGLWIINSVSHAFPIRFGTVYHHWCKDNSITNIVMAIILFSLVKEWTIQSNVVNRLAKNIFAVFALNNAMVSVLMPLIVESKYFQSVDIKGFWLLAFLVACIMLLCIFIGLIREVLLGKGERKIIDKLGELLERYMPGMKYLL